MTRLLELTGSRTVDVLRYEFQVSLERHAAESRKATLFKSEALQWLRSDFHRKTSPLCLTRDQLELFDDLYRSTELGYLSLKNTTARIHMGRYPMLVQEWIRRKPQKILFGSRDDVVDRLSAQIEQQMQDLLENTFSLMVRWGVHSENIPAIDLFGEGLRMMVPDVDVVGFPTVPRDGDEAKEYYFRTYGLSAPNPVILTFDNWNSFTVDWRDKQREDQPVRFQHFFYMGEMLSHALCRTIHMYGTTDLLGIDRRSKTY